MKIDRRKHYILVFDTETANTHKEGNSLDTSSGLVYDFGYMVTDTKGNIYKEGSFICKDIFFGMQEIMKSAYYTDKIPSYLEDISAGKREVKTFYEIRKEILDTLKEYNIKEVSAHNAAFDVKVLNATQRYLTKSKYRFFFPYNIEIWDSMKMANSVIAKMPTYKKFCEKHEYMTKHKTPRPRVTAEILYRFINKNNDFIESHTGLEDVKIEYQIMMYCYKQKKKMKKKLYEKRLDN